MKKLVQFITVGFIIFIISGCSSMNVSVDYDKLNDFSKYETYKIIKPKKPKESKSIYLNDINQKRFMKNIEEELFLKGFERVDGDNADFGIIYHLRFDQKLDITGYSYKYYPLTGYRERYVQTRTYQEGSIIVDIIDREQKLLVWRGAAEGVLRENNNPDKVIKNTIKSILEKFPPGNK